MKIPRVTIILIIVAIALGGIAWYYFAVLEKAETPVLEVPVERTQKEKKPVKENTQFVLTDVSNTGIQGDGTATLKDDLTSIAIRLTAAPELKAGEAYEAYALIQVGTDPQLIGVFAKTSGKTEKFLTAGAGLTSWYKAEKIIITKRVKNAAIPGVVVAEASLAK